MEKMNLNQKKILYNYTLESIVEKIFLNLLNEILEKEK